MEVMHRMKQLREFETKLIAQLRDVQADMCDAVREQKFDGKIISIQPFTFTMKSSQLDNRCLSPEYYSPYAQADAVRSLLDRCNTVKQFEQAVESMLDRKYINVGNSRIMLNDRTLEIIKNTFY